MALLYGMIIEKIEPIALATGTLSLVLCRVTTKSGLVGYGECLCNRPPMQQALVATIRDAIAPLYLGKSAADRAGLNLAARRRLASFGRAGTVTNALAAIDIALWDIAGKADNKSVSVLLGGAKRARLPVMASLDKYDDRTKVRAARTGAGRRREGGEGARGSARHHRGGAPRRTEEHAVHCRQQQCAQPGRHPPRRSPLARARADVL